MRRGSAFVLWPVIPVLCAAVLCLSLFEPSVAPSSGEVRIPMAGYPIPPHAPASRAIVFPDLAGYLTINEGTLHVLAVSDFDREELLSTLEADIYPGIAQLPRLLVDRSNAQAPSDPEQLLLLAPDVVIAWSWTSREMKQIGLPVIDVPPQISAESGIALWRLFGETAANEERSERLIASYRAELKGITKKVKPFAMSNPCSVLVMWQGANRIFVENRLYQHAKDVNALGGRNVAAHLQFPNIDYEELLKLNPEIIFLTSLGSGMPENTPGQIYANPVLQTLSAVKNKHVYMIPNLTDTIVDQPLLLRWMAELMYPNQMSKSFRSDFQQQYHETYGYTMGHDQIDQTIFLQENLASAGYERFLPGSP